MSFFLLTTFSVLHKQVQKSHLCLAVFHQLSDISQTSQLKWEPCKSASHQQKKVLLLQSRLCTFRLMILLIQHPPQRSVTWTQQLCLLVRLQNLEFTQQLIRLIHLHQFLIQTLSDKSIMMLREEFNKFFSDIKICKILLRFLVWMSFLIQINSQFRARARFKSFCHNHFSLQNNLLVQQGNM